MRGLSQNLAGKPALQVGQVFLPWPSQRLKQARQKLCWHGPCTRNTQVCRAVCRLREFVSRCKVTVDVLRETAAACNASWLPLLCRVAHALCCWVLQAGVAATARAVLCVVLTVTGRSHRLKQMTHFSVSSRISDFLSPLLVSAAFLAASFLAPAAAGSKERLA